MQWFKVFSSIEDATKVIPLQRSKLVIIRNHRICLAHTAEGFRAIQDSCPHLGESLHKGTINYLGDIICPWHSYRFNLKTGQEGGAKCGDARTYPVKVEGNCLYIGVELQ